MRKIKMRIKKETRDVCCDACGNNKSKTLEFYDLLIGDTKLILCDECNEVLMNKTLRASCILSNKLKSKDDITIINRRKSKKRTLR